ncbi:MAG: threonine--tRNA ligase [Alphaproteobacteria bacterium]|nr:MAG: threonine--tRNA ligase [Alphaproteobacteria bacterium]|tara:strand:- start:10471 stop:12399 length:1929 start_codon:yes stop_codon:yes gene_type:complete
MTNNNTKISITFPDGNSKEYDKGITGYKIAESIAKSLAKEAIAVEINNEISDLSLEINNDSKLKIIKRNDDEALELIRHDCAHVMAEAVQELFPETQVTIGPAIDNGFYYDFAREKAFIPDDLEIIEKKMHEIIKRNSSFVREVWNRDEAISFFKNKKEEYKAELISDLPKDENITIYKQGDWTDLCKGPHLPSTKHVGKAFKLMKVAGAYWRGDSSNTMLTRIYGTAWRNEEELNNYLIMLEEAEKRDHRKLGREMNLFHFQEESPGSVFWHTKGWLLFQTLVNYMKKRQDAAGYEEINTPDIMDRSLWEKSGHWDKFGENMFTTEEREDRLYALKPMNCPGAVQVYKQGIKSYRDLPLKLSEFGKVHRYEPSGALHGLMRVRGFTQDDAHIFCTEDQITEECKTVCSLIISIYKDFGFENIHIKYSDRPEKRVGSDEIWDKSEEALKIAIEATGLSYTHNPGEGAFYGPKIEFVLRDAIGRDWQCGTLQVDLNLPSRLSANYIAEDGQKYAPVMLHRALFGSIERFIGILIENYSGRLPLWLSPTQIVIATITSDADLYAKEVLKLFKENDLRVEIDIRNEKIGYKIREHSTAKIPILVIIGKQEAEKRELSIRRLGSNNTETSNLETVVNDLKIQSKSP